MLIDKDISRQIELQIDHVLATYEGDELRINLQNLVENWCLRGAVSVKIQSKLLELEEL
jgi:hypothetical protein